MKKTTILFFTLTTSFMFSQVYDTYTAKNGTLYKLGYTIRLNVGSGQQGDFLYLQVEGWAKAFVTINDIDRYAGFSRSNSNPSKSFAGISLILKKINKDKSDHISFTVSAKKGSNYTLQIEEAIQSCEVENCKQQLTTFSTDKYDKLKKIQDLKDSGTLNNEEFEVEKDKIIKEL